MGGDGSYGTPIGVFWDLRGGLEGGRLMIVELTASDRVILRCAGESGPVLLWSHCTGADLDAAIASLFARFVA